MSTTAPTAPRVSPREVHDVLKRHMLVDGYHLVQDLERSHGSFIYDSSRDREVLDFYTSFATVPLGYNHPKMVDAETRERLVGAALNKLANSDIYTTEMATFVETFARTLPQELSHHLFFIEGGTLAVENALKAAFDWKVRKNLAAGKGDKGYMILHFKEAFHGRSGYSLSLTNTDPRKIENFPKFPWPRVSNPKLSFPLTGAVLEQVKLAELQTIAEIEQALRDNPDQIAALIIEPIQGEGGDNHFRGEFLHQLRRLADQHEFLLIFDEVQTGFGTTGKWWAFEHFGVIPDIISFGKKTQVCGIAASRRLDEVDSVFKVSSRINSTWGGNLVDMVRCTRIIEIVEEDNLLDNVTRVGERMLDNLHRLEAAFPGQVSSARGRGMFVAFDLPDGETRKAALAALNEANVLGLSSGSRAIRFRPALNLTADEADEGMRRVEKALRGLLR
jgi:L-lysine 6-transaminase